MKLLIFDNNTLNYLTVQTNYQYQIELLVLDYNS